MNLLENITQHALLVIGVLLIMMAIMIVANYLIVKKLKTKHQKAIGLANSNHKSNLTAIEKLKGEVKKTEERMNNLCTLKDAANKTFNKLNSERDTLLHKLTFILDCPLGAVSTDYIYKSFAYKKESGASVLKTVAKRKVEEKADIGFITSGTEIVTIKELLASLLVVRSNKFLPFTVKKLDVKSGKEIVF